jgi:hypothetical protein
MYEQIFIDSLNPAFNINKIAGKPPSRKGKSHKPSEAAKEKIKKAAYKREARRFEEICRSEMWIYEGILESGLSVRKFCELNNLTKNRASINRRFRRYVNDIKETTEKSTELDSATMDNQIR